MIPFGMRPGLLAGAACALLAMANAASAQSMNSNSA